MITIENLNIGYGRRLLLSEASASFGGCSLTALIGRNGTGKSTLLRALAGLNHDYSGDIDVDGVSLRGLRPAQLARHLAFVNTQRTRVSNMSCYDVVAMGRAPYTDWIGNLSPADHQIIESSLKAIDMADYANRPVDTLSDGECQRVMIARALAQDTPNILLDEPTSFLDLPNRYKLVELLHELAHTRSKCIIFSTHELDIALKRADNIALLADSTIFNLPAREMASSGLINRYFGIEI